MRSTVQGEDLRPHSGIRGVSICVEDTDPATVPSSVVTRRPSGRWEAWHSDQLNSFTIGSFRQCVAYARRAAPRRAAPYRPAPTITL